MKRWQIGIFALLLSFTLTSCSDKDKSANKALADADAVLKEAKLSNSEKEFLGTFTDNSFIYKLNVKNKKIKEIAISIDEYSMGEYKKTLMRGSSHLDEQDYGKPVTLLFARQVFNEKQVIWTHSTILDGARSTFKGESKIDPKASIACGQITMPLEIKKGEKVVIGTLVETDKDSTTIFNTFETEKNFNLATNYEHVYVMYLELK